MCYGDIPKSGPDETWPRSVTFCPSRAGQGIVNSLSSGFHADTRITLLRHPLFWFLLLGGLLFAADAWFADRPEKLIVNDAVRNRLADLWQSQSGRPPGKDELDSLVDNWIREEVFYREALRLQLDKDDTIIRRRLIQKLDFIAEDVDEPDEADIEDYYDRHIDRYRLPPRFTFQQIFFATEHERALDAALEVIHKNDAGWRRYGDPGMLNDSWASRTRHEIASTFGSEFVDQLADIEPGQWTGPVASVFGLHLVKVISKEPAHHAAFADVKREVLNDYLQDKRAQARQRYYRRLLERYEIVRQ